LRRSRYSKARSPPTSARIWAEVSKRLGKRAEGIVKEASEIIAALDRGGIVSSLLGLGDNTNAYLVKGDTILGFERKELEATPAAGVDSSSTKPVRVGHHYYGVVSAAVVAYPEGRNGNILEEILAETAVTPDRAEPAQAMQELNLLMFETELRALRLAPKLLEASKDKYVVFLDGPIIDPPHVIGGSLQEKFEEYIRERAQTVRDIIENGGFVIGIVKRVYGSLFVNTLSRELSNELGEILADRRVSDYSLAVYLGAILVMRNLFEPGRHTMVLHPFSLDDAGIVAAEFYRKEGVNVYSFLMIPVIGGKGKEGKPIRVEFALPNDANAMEATRRAAALIDAWLLHGHNVPEPVMLAHMRCTIRRRDASRMLREIATRSIYLALTKLGSQGLQFVTTEVI